MTFRQKLDQITRLFKDYDGEVYLIDDAAIAYKQGLEQRTSKMKSLIKTPTVWGVCTSSCEVTSGGYITDSLLAKHDIEMLAYDSWQFKKSGDILGITWIGSEQYLIDNCKAVFKLITGNWIDISWVEEQQDDTIDDPMETSLLYFQKVIEDSIEDTDYNTPFEPDFCVEPDGDCIEFAFSNDSFYARRLNNNVTIYISEDSGKIVGGLLKNLQKHVDNSA